VIAANRIAGAETIVAVDRRDKLERARAFGATHVVAVDEDDDPPAAVRELTGGGVDHAFEVVGEPSTIRLAWSSVRSGGDVVVVGLVARGVDVSVPGIEFLSDKSLKGTYYGSGDAMRDLPALAQLALAGELDLGSAVTHRTTLDGVEEAFARLRRGEGARTVVLVDEELSGSALH
jgi:S-(hydroxymethyl)glutathione dehydrogenase/alcohol dehydrogenase